MHPFKRIGCIVNPVAGGNSTLSPEVLNSLQVIEETYEKTFITYTEYRGAELECAGDLLHKRVDCVVIFGGDGSLHHTINAFMRLASDNLPVFAHFPCGSGNDFARMLKLPDRPRDFLNVLLASNITGVDLGEINFRQMKEKHWFINCLGVGLDVEVVRRVNTTINHNSMSYLKSIGKAFKNYGFPELHIEVCNAESTMSLSFEGTFAMICNGAYAGSGMHFAPGARVNDGRFDLICVKKAWKPAILAHLPLLYTGKHTFSPLLRRYYGGSFTFNNPELDIQADGEIIGKADCSIDLLKERIRFIVP